MAIAKRSHPFPFRTRKLSSSAPMVLHGRPCGRVGRRRILNFSPSIYFEGLFLFEGGNLPILDSQPADLIISNMQYDVINRFVHIQGFFEKEYYLFSGLLRSDASVLKADMVKEGLPLVNEWDYDLTWFALLARKVKKS